VLFVVSTPTGIGPLICLGFLEGVLTARLGDLARPLAKVELLRRLDHLLVGVVDEVDLDELVAHFDRARSVRLTILQIVPIQLLKLLK
jgi:hypothetical protein